MKATGWQNGKGGTYGIRVGVENAREFFDRNRASIEVEIGGRSTSFTLTQKFWTTCPEFRGAAIGAWLRDNGLAPWPSGQPPIVELTPLGPTRFKLSR